MKLLINLCVITLFLCNCTKRDYLVKDQEYILGRSRFYINGTMNPNTIIAIKSIISKTKTSQVIFLKPYCCTLILATIHESDHVEINLLLYKKNSIWRVVDEKKYETNH